MQTKAEHGSNYEIKQRNQKREARNLGMKHKNLRRRNTEPGRWRNSAGDTQLKRRRDADEPATNRKTQLTLIRLILIHTGIQREWKTGGTLFEKMYVICWSHFFKREMSCKHTVSSQGSMLIQGIHFCKCKSTTKYCTALTKQ